ncbi:hypothetical protein SteCoe_25738 [Stentor coeruleus]|uniref:Uncharacterized protein n=1 Tax=Stentor coeruleus TaxID=5963 RepID=A0A1R2BEI7_9CILI|nr:hypothetical protein SteCoe_25738 [Stentor coeruleus]
MDSNKNFMNRTKPTKEKENQLKTQEESVRREQKCKAQVQKKIKNSQIYTDKIHNYKLEIQDLSAKINARIWYYKQAEKSAIKIQKVYRGHLTRHLYADEVSVINGFTLKKILKDIKKSDDYNLFYTGKRTVWAAGVINRFMKRIIFLLKIRRIEEVYKHLKSVKEAETCKNLRMDIRIFVANMRIKHDIKKKFGRDYCEIIKYV